MAAGDFSASQMPLVLLKQNRIFLGGARVNSQRNDSRLQTVKAVLENQTARPIPVMTGRECTTKYFAQNLLKNLDLKASAKHQN